MSSEFSERYCFDLEYINPFKLETSTWEEFSQLITEQPIEKIEQESVNLEQNLRGYFIEATRKADETMEKTPDILESSFTKKCLGDLIMLGPYVLEDTSNSVKDRTRTKVQTKRTLDSDTITTVYEEDYVATRFRKLGFVESRLGSTSSRVDITIRERFEEEQKYADDMCKNIIPYWSDNEVPPKMYPLPSFRVMPWETVAWVELRRPAITNLERIDILRQVCYYCESLLRVHPRREHSFALLTNLQSCIFVAARTKRDAEGNRCGFRWFYSNQINDRNSLIEELVSFFMTSKA